VLIYHVVGSKFPSLTAALQDCRTASVTFVQLLFSGILNIYLLTTCGIRQYLQTIGRVEFPSAERKEKE
jgi:hypothetical protein